MDDPQISPSKQNRILIWRNEVATALSPDIPLPSHRSGISSTSTTSTTSTKSSSLSAVASRLSNLFRRLSPSSSARQTAQAAALQSSKTDMYISLRAEYNGRLDNGERAATFLAEGLEEDAHQDEYDGDSDSQAAAGAAAALKEKQDRLLRAARLLHEGPSKQ